MGEYHALIAEMRLSDHESFYKYFHMTPQRFSHLLSIVGPAIQRQDTRLRAAIVQVIGHHSSLFGNGIQCRQCHSAIA